ncbi:Mobile element protein [Vibrio crassostreae]|uniref:Uncharacterized protein n=3 Tax=Vibrionaceae TaxID=641 RepID=A0A0H3ZY34_9VIBR|nr:hypothetical protein [Enterovibrio sp. FF_113]AKN38774.1 hypothetical protein [Vibrio tasmaniensis]AKN40084.1 hypothetical protein [Enterovibrio norvegicus]CAK1724221.1 Mobile element protein [Vibrio crassostreae]AKN39721.1 hypothetical protein [Enterovibrio sp. FF_113]
MSENKLTQKNQKNRYVELICETDMTIYQFYISVSYIGKSYEGNKFTRG